MRYTPEAGMVARRYYDPATGEALVRHGPNARLKCMRVRYAPAVSFVRYGGPGSSVTVVGVTRCQSTWACPACMYAMLRERGEELKRTVTAWHDAQPKRRRVFLLTLTARHHAHTDEASLRDAVQESWRELWQGKAAQEFKENAGMAGWCRRLEVNYGVNGAHPHQHAVMAFHDEKSPAEIEDIRRWFLDRWRGALERRGFTCDDAHGANIVYCDHDGQYLVKMGLGLVLELTASNQKEAAEGSRTPLKVLEDFALHGRDEDGRLWQRHCDTWRGRRMLEWSRGRMAWRVRGEPGELALPGTAPAVVATVSGADWDAIDMADRYRERLAQQELAEATDTQQTAADWGAQQLWRLGRTGSAGLPEEPLAQAPARREILSVRDWTPPDEESWRPPEWWWRQLRPEEIAERVQAEGLSW